MTVQRALVAFPFKRQPTPTDKRGLVLACDPRNGRLASMMVAGLAHPPMMDYRGVMVWEGLLYFEGDDVPADALRRSAWRDKLLWDGSWHTPTVGEWEQIRKGRSPWR